MTTEKKMTEAIEILKQIPFAEIQRAGYHFQVNDYYSPLRGCRQKLLSLCYTHWT